MYNPISLNVIRQSLKWMGAPAPITISVPSPTIATPTGIVMAQVNMVFVRRELLDWAQFAQPYSPEPDLALIQSELQGCFCDDIAVQPINNRLHDRLLAVTLLASITARD